VFNKMATDLNDQDFKKEVLDSKGVSLVDFWAEWCGPCRMLGPIVDEIAEDYKGRMNVFKVNVDENQETAGYYNVMSIPTLILFKDGQPVETMVGVQPKESLAEKIDQYLK